MSEYNSAYTGAQIDEAVRKSLADVENPVASFNGRTGAVMPQAGDYTAAMVGAISQDDLQSATDAALEQAKNSGEFDGADGQDGSDGVSCTHSWNGTTLTVTSASGTSSADLKGDKGDTGGTGATGVGIASVQQTTTSTDDDGNNIITVTLTDGTTHTFTVQNGSKGSTGATGADGAAGSDGADGKSAYQAAVEGGYSGTETGLNNALAQVPSHIANTSNPHGVTAAQVGAAALASPNDMLHNSNEFTIIPAGYTGEIYFNYRTASGATDGGVSNYHFCNGAGGEATLMAGYFKGKFQGSAARPEYNGEEVAMLSDISKPKTVSITLAAASWTEGTEAYEQTVTVEGGTTTSLVALQPTVAQIISFQEDGVSALMVNNNNGVFIAYSVGAAPSADMTLQATLTEVSA